MAVNNKEMLVVIATKKNTPTTTGKKILNLNTGMKAVSTPDTIRKKTKIIVAGTIN